MKISQAMTAFFIEQNIISEDQKQIYEYGFELIFADLINFVLIILASIGLHSFSTGIIYLCVFVSMRLFCGGFHAETHAMCRIYMLVMFLVFMALYSAFSVTKIQDVCIIFVSLPIAWIPIFRYAPVIHQNKILSDEYRQKNRVKTFAIGGGWTVLSVILILAGVPLGIAIGITIWIVSVSIVLGKIKSVRRGEAS